MPLRKRPSQLFEFVLVPVVFIILGAFVVSGASVFENQRFVKASSQIWGFVRTVRTFINEQKTFSFAIGEDAWAAMVRVQRIPGTTRPLNPWGGSLRAIAVTSTDIRIESDLPSQDCRRTALYFIGLGPENLGLLSVQAQSDQDTKWYLIYPPPSSKQVAAAEASCGPTAHSRLALIFKIK
ncbi:MAG: hypothetical protein WC521_03800 [Bdellovibrionales bacterium]